MIELSIGHVLLALVPLALVLVIYGHTVQDWTSVPMASVRMFVQLIAIGYGLNFIFGVSNPFWVFLVIFAMSVGAGLIAFRSIRKFKQSVFPVFGAVMLSGGLNLCWVLAVVIQPAPWFEPSVVIPIAGMVMANAMNSVSICAERYWSEREKDTSIKEAKKAGMRAAMIPQINALFAVGLVSLPGMMTGQILSGVSPLIAVRYQIVIMAMVMSTASLGSFLYLHWYDRKQRPQPH